MLWSVWLSWLGIIPQSKASQVCFPISAHAWVVGLLPGVPSLDAYEGQLMDVSLPLFLPPFPVSKKINKIFKKIRAWREKQEK